MKHMSFMDEPNSETYSDNSYNDSDDGSVTTSDDEDDGTIDNNDISAGDDMNGLFWTPDTHRGNSQLSSARMGASSTVADRRPAVMAERAYETRPARSGGLAQEGEDERLSSRAEASTSSHALPHMRNLVAGSRMRQGFTASQIELASDDIDRSSITLPRGGEAYQHNNNGPNNQPRNGTAPKTSLHKALRDFGLSSEDEHMSIQYSTPKQFATGARSFSVPRFSHGSSHLVLSSIDCSDRSATLDPINASPSSTGSSQVSSRRPGSRKRAASRPTSHERHSSRSCSSSSSSSASAYLRSVQLEAHRTGVTHSNDKIKKERIERGSTHSGCNSYRPCKQLDRPSSPIEPRAVVYCDTIGHSQNLSIAQAEFILTRCTCHWAIAFDKVWRYWSYDEAANENERLSKPELLVNCYPEKLRQAARECCPPDPTKIVSITIDDD